MPETKMKWMLLSTMIPMAILIIVLLLFFCHYTNEYNQLSNNLAVSAEYNANYKNSNNDMSFKDEVDMDIYYVTIALLTCSVGSPSFPFRPIVT